MTLDFSLITPYLHLIAKGTAVTLEVSILGVIIGTLGGLLVGAARVVPFKPLRGLAALYIFVLRGTPLMVQLYLIYFALPQLGINLPAFWAGVIGIGVNSSAYVGELTRGGIAAVPKGQWEAAKMLGLSWSQTLTSIIMPQAWRIMLPGIGNEFVSLIKESSLLSTLAVSDLTQAGQQVRSVTYASLETFLLVAAVYLILTSLFSGAVALMERRLKKAA